MVVILLLCLLAGISYGAASAYLQYSHVRSEAMDGMLHLRHVQGILASYLKHPGIPDTATLRSVERELTAAESDFARTRRDLHNGVFSLAARASGSASNTIGSASTLVNAADEACLAGLDLVRAAGIILPVLHGSLIGGGISASPSATPSAPSETLTATMLHRAVAAFEDAMPHLNTAILLVRHADISALPPNLITRQQLAELRGLVAEWPHVHTQLALVDAWLQAAPALLGVNGPERLLVELMDRGEMRSTGGYIGDYGVMTIEAGKLQPFTLNDIYTLDAPYMQRAGWRQAPAAYPWWPFPGFALRDSNLSANFPTTAKMGIHLLRAEGGPQVQGVVALTSTAIERVLAIVGPVSVPEYHQTVTAQNLEALIRLNTETNYRNIRSLHERFTALLGQAFMNKLHNLSTSQLMAVAKTLLMSLQTKDIQVYLSDKAAEALLSEQGLDNSIAHGPGDGLTIVDSNAGVNKANAFTTVIYTDTVTLDTHGTATHHLTITYRFDSSNNPSLRYFLYGRDFLFSYLRVYTPPNALLASWSGFNGTYYNRSYHEIGQSDEPGRQMWGGYVYVLDSIPYSLHFVWSVPRAATRDVAGQWHYTLVVQHQAGSNQQLNLTVIAPDTKTPILAYRGALDRDRLYSVAY